MDPQNFQQKYTKLLAQFNSYRQKILTQKQHQLQQTQKYKSHIDKTYKQIQKKYQTKLQQQRLANQKKQKKLQALLKQKQQDFNAIIEAKDKFIQDLKRRLMQNQQDKNQIIQGNTKMLYQLCQDMENSQEILGPHKNSYKDLVRLYQFVLQQNNNLKKQLFKVQLKHKQPCDENKQSVNKSSIAGIAGQSINTNANVTVNLKDEKKKKKTTNTSFDNSKMYNQSIRPKTTHYHSKKQQKK